MSLTVVVPAYNEENRIEPFLRELVAFKKKNAYFKELIVVNDGSTDKTAGILQKYANEIRILAHEKNRGKGAAIKTGVLAAKSGMVVFMDADGSIPVYEIPKMVEALKTHSVVVGSRIAKGARVLVKQPLSRIIASKGFNFIVNILFPLHFNDTLCGFKGMQKQPGREIASKLVSNGWVFDVEILARAQKIGFGFGVIPIDWKDVRDSKMRLGATTIKMFLDLLRLKREIYGSKEKSPMAK